MTDQTYDKNGRPWAKLSELKSGDKIELDGGFGCHKAGNAEVLSDDTKPEGDRLFFGCYYGHHFLSGQADDGEHCVGVYGPIKEEPK